MEPDEIGNLHIRRSRHQHPFPQMRQIFDDERHFFVEAQL